MDIQTKWGYIFTLAGVFLGGVIGLFSPLIINILDKKKQKRELKHNLLRSIYVFYNTRKEHCRTTCQYCFLIHRDKLYRAAKHVTKDEKEIEHFQWVISTDREQNQHNLERTESLYLNLMEIEANLIVMVNEIKYYYGNYKYQIINPMIRSIIDDSNKPNSYPTDLQSTHFATLDKEQPLYEQRTAKQIIEYQRQCDALIEKISRIL